MPPFRLELWEGHPTTSITFFDGPIIVGAGPSGLAVAACLRKNGINSLILERSDCIASLWEHKTYDRIHLHLPKQFCALPLLPVPQHYPKYMSKAQFLDYLHSYAECFNISPRFNEKVVNAKYNEMSGLWRVTTATTTKATMHENRRYATYWLIVASGENAEAMVPWIDGIQSFKGDLCHSSAYKNGAPYKGKKVLVVGCGNSGMEIALDLLHFKAMPSIVVRNSVHILPRDILGKATFSIIVRLLKVFPVWFADMVLLFFVWLKWKDTAKSGLQRPTDGPIACKNRLRRTPVLDIGTYKLIREGKIKVLPGIESFNVKGVKLANGNVEDFDAVVLATGYRSNVTEWLCDEEHFSADGLPKTSVKNVWKGQRGLYTVGFLGRGLLGTSTDAELIAKDIKHNTIIIHPQENQMPN